MENKEHFLEKWKAQDGGELKRYNANGFIGIIEGEAEIKEFSTDLFFTMI